MIKHVCNVNFTFDVLTLVQKKAFYGTGIKTNYDYRRKNEYYYLLIEGEVFTVKYQTKVSYFMVKTERSRG